MARLDLVGATQTTFTIPALMHFSNILDCGERTDIGLQFTGSCLLPCLNMGVTDDSFNRSGKYPVLKDRLTMCDRGPMIAGARSLRILIEMPLITPPCII